MPMVAHVNFRGCTLKKLYYTKKNSKKYFTVLAKLRSAGSGGRGDVVK